MEDNLEMRTSGRLSVNVHVRQCFAEAGHVKVHHFIVFSTYFSETLGAPPSQHISAVEHRLATGMMVAKRFPFQPFCFRIKVHNYHSK